jgi:hypothetical protein
VLTDGRPLESQGLTTDSVGRALWTNKDICFVASPDLDGFRRCAEEDGGEWYLTGLSMDMAALLRFFRLLVKDVAKVARQCTRSAAARSGGRGPCVVLRAIGRTRC